MKITLIDVKNLIKIRIKIRIVWIEKEIQRLQGRRESLIKKLDAIESISSLVDTASDVESDFSMTSPRPFPSLTVNSPIQFLSEASLKKSRTKKLSKIHINRDRKNEKSGKVQP